MNTSNASSQGRRASQGSVHTSQVVPVTQLCEIACIIFCRMVVPKLARGVDLAG